MATLPKFGVVGAIQPSSLYVPTAARIVELMAAEIIFFHFTDVVDGRKSFYCKFILLEFMPWMCQA